MPYNIKLYESFIPRQLADNLVNGTNPVEWTRNPQNRFETFYFRRKNDKVDEYVCSIPPPETRELLHKIQEEQNSHENEAELLTKAVNIVKNFLPPTRCMFADNLRGSYWTYAYCLGDKIIQYHEVLTAQERESENKARRAEIPSTIFVLGRFLDASAKKVALSNQATLSQTKKYLDDVDRTFRLLDDKSSPFSHHSSQKVVLHTIMDGSICDMTLQPRSIEVIYKCDPEGSQFQPQIVEVHEIKTCQYKMFVHVPGLCLLEPFVFNKNVNDALIHVECQLIGEDLQADAHRKTFEDYSGRVVLRDRADFPVRSDNRICIADHEVTALARGFYLARSKSGYRTPSAYYNLRHVVLFNGFYDLADDLNQQLGQVIFECVGTKLMAPAFENDQQLVLDWSDSFVMWFEVYSFAGEFLGLSKIEKETTGPHKKLTAQLVDPETLKDTEGHHPLNFYFDLPVYEAPHNFWNFQSYSRSQTGEIKTVRKEGKNFDVGKTVFVKETVTVTVDHYGTAEAVTVTARESQETESEQVKNTETVDAPDIEAGEIATVVVYADAVETSVVVETETVGGAPQEIQQVQQLEVPDSKEKEPSEPEQAPKAERHEQVEVVFTEVHGLQDDILEQLIEEIVKELDMDDYESDDPNGGLHDEL